jgi:diguanylate cyclase (GGDEF)-like protein/PAS domain S-box-containing protein
VRWLTPPEGLIARPRWFFALVALANLAIVLPLITTASRPAVDVQVLAVAAGACLGALWLIAYRRNRFGLTSDFAAACALLVIGVPLLSVEHALGLHAAAVVHRSMYRRDRHAGLPAALQALAYLGSGLLRGGELTAGGVDIDLIVQAGLLAFAGPVLTHVVSVLEEHERAADRAKILAAAGSALITTSDPAEIGEIGLGSARQLLEGHHAHGFAIALAEGPRLVVSAADPHGPKQGTELSVRALPGPVREAVTEADAFTVAAPLFPRAGSSAAGTWLVVPLLSHGVLRGLLTAETQSCPDESCGCESGLTALGGQLALALEGAVLNRDLRASETRFRSLVQHSSDVVVVLDGAGEIRYISPAVAKVMAHDPPELGAGRLDAIVHPEDLGAWNQFLHRLVVDVDAGLLHCRLRHGDGSWLHGEVHGANLLDEPSVGGLVLNIRDVSDRRALEADLRNQAFHDPLTGLANRARFLDLLKGALADERRRDRITVLFIDLDGFKAVNDRLGHAGGDDLLVTVANRLTSTLRETECIARLSGDEFGVFAEGIGPTQAAEMAQRLLDSLAEPCEVQREEIRISASVGVAIGGTGVEDASDLLHRADLAMYTAKAAGRARFKVFDAGTHGTTAGQRELASELASALKNCEFEVRYQPIVGLSDGRVVSAEALVRWHHPRRGLLGPGTWIGLAEDEGLIGEVFELVLNEACGQARTWRDLVPDAEAPGVAVNLSARQLCEPGLLDQVARAVARAEIPPPGLTIELAETVLHSDPHAAATVLGGLKEIGVTIALDDFGTGYSSLTNLRRLPIDVLKIDKTFVDGLGSRGTHGTLARATIELGRRLGVRTIAEGVERVEQQLRLQEFGCDYGQGYLFSRPLVGVQFHDLLRQRTGKSEKRPPINVV